MVRVNIFGIENCGKCLTAKTRAEAAALPYGERVDVVYHDQGTFEGRAEGAWYDVDDELPVMVIEDGNRSVARWEGRAPKTDELSVALETVLS